MSLPEVWQHRTAKRMWQGPLEEGGARPTAAMALLNKTRHARSLHVLRVLTLSDFRARYRAQALGVVWSVLSPLVMMGIMSVVLTKVFNARAHHYPIFLLIGLLVWEWISTSISAATQVFVSQSDMIKRTVFSREVLPVAMTLSYAVNFGIAGCALLIFVPIFPDAFTLAPSLLVVPVLLVILGALITGIGMATSVLNVIYRDVAYLVNTGLMLLQWLTPVIYPPDIIPYPYRSILAWNPMGAILTALRGAIMEGAWPDAQTWMHIVLPTMVVVGLGWSIFKRTERLVLDYV